MGRRGDPPEGPPEGPPGGEDEYGSVVFDESFVNAARVQEFSAVERMGDHARAVRSLPAQSRRAPRRILLLVLLVALAFGTAVYLGVRQPYQPAVSRPGETLRTTLVPLAPHGIVAGGTPEQVLDHGQAAQYRTGAAGIALPAVRRTDHFTEDQVTTALATVKDYLVASSVDPDVLTGGQVRAVRALLNPDQLDQFDRSMSAPAADGRHAATGWLVRFDPAEVELAAGGVRVSGALLVTERDAGALEVTADHTFAYALRPAAAAGPVGERASLYTVRRELHFRLDRDDLRRHRLTVLTSYVQAGPQDCAEDTAAVLHPLLAGRRATSTGPADTDPYASGPAGAALCGALADRSGPSPAAP
ncbi:SCO2583 family membrane protein [Streptomyces zhihengii]